jgi:hexosaminidase
VSGFRRRAYMLDVSRDRVPTGETLDWLIDVLAAVGFNELQLYVEHTFAYLGHDVVWEHASPLTHHEMRRLDDRCGAAGLDLVANMNGFGHMGRWLAHDEYRSRAECPDGHPSILGDGWSQPGCLAPTPENARFAVALARDIASTVRHPRIHIGGDEPFELGDGVSADLVARNGRDRVYLEHLVRIIEPLVADGHEVMFWADLFRRDASLLPSIPFGSVPVVWNYEAPSDFGWIDLLGADLWARLGMPDDANLGFEAHARLFIDASLPFWVAPGTSSWNTVIGRNGNAAANIADAVRVGSDHGSPGLLLTDWGDNGHWQPLAVSLPSIVRAGVASRTGELPSGDEVATTVDEVTGFRPGTGELLDRLGHLGEDLGLTSPNGSPVSAAMAHDGLPVFGDPDPEGFDRAAALLDEASTRFGSGSVGGPRGEVVAAELAAACRLARLGLRRLAVVHGCGLQGTTPEEPSSAEVEAVIDGLRDAWLRSSRPGGLDDSVARIRV